MIDWYGNNRNFNETDSSKIVVAYRNRLEVIYKKLADKKGIDV